MAQERLISDATLTDAAMHARVTGKLRCRIARVWVVSSASPAHVQELPLLGAPACLPSATERVAAPWSVLQEPGLSSAACDRDLLCTTDLVIRWWQCSTFISGIGQRAYWLLLMLSTLGILRRIGSTTRVLWGQPLTGKYHQCWSPVELCLHLVTVCISL